MVRAMRQAKNRKTTDAAPVKLRDPDFPHVRARYASVMLTCNCRLRVAMRVEAGNPAWM
jgi:hypothetical protein